MAQEHAKAVRRRNGEAVRHKAFCGAGTLPLNINQKELIVGDKLPLGYSDQQSEYDPSSDEGERGSLEGQALKLLLISTVMRLISCGDQCGLAQANLFLLTAKLECFTATIKFYAQSVFQSVNISVTRSQRSP